jgi:hypothetical protein
MQDVGNYAGFAFGCTLSRIHLVEIESTLADELICLYLEHTPDSMIPCRNDDGDRTGVRSWGERVCEQ